MASEHYDTVYPDVSHDLDDEDEDSESEDDDVNPPDMNDDYEEEDLNFPSMPSPSPPPPPVVVTTAAAVLESLEPISTMSSVTIALPSTSAVTVASIPNGTDPSFVTPVQHDSRRLFVTGILHEDKQKPQLEDSRRLFQRLWTDEDEIELLQGFLEFTMSHRSAGGSSHHPDTGPFYEKIKSKLQFDFNKNQLVEKLRRLKKKYRNVMNKMNSGKDVSFKTPHDHATFEISRKIWSDTGKIIGFEDNVLDDEEININVSTNNNNNNINNNSIVTFYPNYTPQYEVKVEDGGVEKLATSSSRSRKRSRSKPSKVEEDPRILSDGFVVNNIDNVGSGSGASAGAGGGVGGVGGGGGGGNVAGVIEETVRSSLSPLLKEISNGAAMMKMMGGVSCGGGRGMGAFNPLMAMPPLGLALGSSNGGGAMGEAMDERWRKQQILELEVYSKRLELVQDQIKASLEELRSAGGG